MERKYLLLVAFTSGMVIMSVEMTASRLLAPYFGTSIFVWTNIIGLVMVSLSLGYYIGGKLADKKPSRTLLLQIIALASMLTFIIPFMARPVATLSTVNIFSISTSSLLILIGSFAATLILFAIPLFLMGMVSPFVIRLLTKDEKTAGNTAGSVFAVSTVGSILGTFLSTLAMVPLIGTKRTILVSALLLLLLSSIGLIKKNKKLIIAFIILAPLFFLNLYGVKDTVNALYEGESAYQYIEVVEDENQNRMLLYNEGIAISSVYNPEKILTGYYYDNYNLLPYIIDKDEIDVLVIGFAGGTIASQFNNLHNDIKFNIDGVEIDDKVIKVAEAYFDIEYNNINIFNEEGRVFLSQTEKKYDLIIIDAYNNQLHIPFHLTTEEFFELVHKKVSGGGILAMNINAESKDSELLGSIANSISKNFENTKITPIGNSYNFMVAASDKEIDYKKVDVDRLDPLLFSIFENTAKKSWDYRYSEKYMRLTDDKAPIEYLTDKMIFEFLDNRS